MIQTRDDRCLPVRAHPARGSESQCCYGFTLVELLVVIAIIAVLAALIMPAVSSVKASGQAIKCAANLRQIYIASQSWSADNDGRIVPVFSPGQALAKSLNNWTGLLAPYLGRSSTNDFTSANDLPVAVCPSNPQQFGYGYNYAYLSWIQFPEKQQWATMAQIGSRPGGLSKTVFLSDRENQVTPDSSFTAWTPFLRPASAVAGGLKDSAPSFRHPGKTANVLWMDGHVSAEKANGDWMNPNDSYWGNQ